MRRPRTKPAVGHDGRLSDKCAGDVTRDRLGHWSEGQHLSLLHHCSYRLPAYLPVGTVSIVGVSPLFYVPRAVLGEPSLSFILTRVSLCVRLAIFFLRHHTP